MKVSSIKSSVILNQGEKIERQQENHQLSLKSLYSLNLKRHRPKYLLLKKYKIKCKGMINKMNKK